MNPIRVLLADDERPLRDALRLLVNADSGMTVVAEACDGVEAVDSSAKFSPDVVLMDLQMPRMNGLEATRRVCATPSGPRVIVLTMFDLDHHVYEALRAGASGFLLKNSPPPEVLHAIRVAHEGNAMLSPEVTKRLIEHLTPAVARDPRMNLLTTRERETLTLIGQGCTNEEIAAALFVTRTTVRTYVSRILTKLHARDRAQLVVAAYEAGIVSRRG